MARMGMGEKWIRWIKFCISTAKFYVIVNGSSQSFSRVRRDRQGDPLSPFLFVIVMEALSRIMIFAENNGLIHGVDCGSGRAPFYISHLFADDTLCMIQVFRRNFKHLCDILWLFGLARDLALILANLKFSSLILCRLGEDLVWRMHGVGGNSFVVFFLVLASITIYRDATIKDMYDTCSQRFAHSIRYRRKLSLEKSSFNDKLLSLVANKGVSPLNQDTMRWRNLYNFDVGHCYYLFNRVVPTEFCWEKLWESKIPTKIYFFGWSAIHTDNLTDDRYMRKGLILVSQCRMCLKDVETPSSPFIL
ncbi:uncharacterized protein LOC124935466 [Impatiens glandulifera]|uniref:uncharacterized protein LOC124935466 n=1 Tax=Impatiens glandulifera TaxID=253017 RepID=UPI001FB11494|nr:uncharacterized protein LOC124935466 [Impatiens glandulifera]